MAVTSSKRVGRSSFTMRRTNDWVMSTDVPTDVTVEAGGTSFALHKFPLVARSGKIRKLVADARDSDLSRLELSDMPGGAEALELAAKFCYGINFEITASNVAMLRCAAEYLEMTDEYGQGNLVARCEAFLEDVVVHSFGSAITVLQACEKLLPMAEELNIVSRCVQAAGSKACQEQIAAALSKSPQMDWWAEDLSILGLDLYQRVLAVMKSQGMPHDSLWGSLMHYAQHALKGLSSKSPATVAPDSSSTAAMEHEQRMLVETIVSLLPPEKNAASCSFLFGLLRTAIILDTTLACRLELERRIGMQLEEATLDDLLIPSFSYTADTLFDTDIVTRIVSNFLQQQQQQQQQSSKEEQHQLQLLLSSSEAAAKAKASSSPNTMIKVAKLVDCYLAEIAPDANLKLSKFITLAELVPEHARIVDDGLYRATDIFFKAHPTLGDAERKRVCKLMDAHRLSQEACTHAAQNERLPAHFIIQLLFFEQLRLKTALAAYAKRDQDDAGIIGSPPRAAENHHSALRRENRDLKLEITRMRMRLSNLEKDQDIIVDKSTSSSNSNNLGGGKFLQSFSKRLGKLNPFARSLLSKPPPTPGTPRPRRRRHSVS